MDFSLFLTSIAKCARLKLKPLILFLFFGHHGFLKEEKIEQRLCCDVDNGDNYDDDKNDKNTKPQFSCWSGGWARLTGEDCGGLVDKYRLEIFWK